jgi:hypothetical protein
MLLLQDSLELCMVPRVVEELLGIKLVTPPPPSTKDIPSPPAVEGEVVERCTPAIVCAPSHPAVSGESAALGAHQQVRLIGRACRGSIHPRLLKPCHRLPYMKPSRRRLGHHWLCSLLGGASPPATPGRRFRVPCGLLRFARGAVVEVLCSHDRRRGFPPLVLSSYM